MVKSGAGRDYKAPRELLLHTGLDGGLMAELAADVSANRRQLRRHGISAHPGETLLPAVLRNDWSAWNRLERGRLWKPWRRHEHLWAVAPGLVPSLLQERRFGRLRQQVDERGFQLAIVVHLFDGREQLARDFARCLMAFRCAGSYDAFAARQLERHPQRYRLDRLFEPLLEWCGARGLRFVLHPPGGGHRLASTWTTLSLFGGAGCSDLPASGGESMTAPPPWQAGLPISPDLSPRAVALAQQCLQGLNQPPRGERRQQLRRKLKAQLAGSSLDEAPKTSWADLFDAPSLAAEFAEAQQRFGLRVWGMDWPAQGPITPAALPLALSRHRFCKPPGRTSLQALRRREEAVDQSVVG
ncbi:hypothetical protein IQ216_01600 [Cyanobium sp. LEGE 06143]|uniref:hypothetical protein n=1 Tax=Cyanobium sp. LEGE 06143 TaxID=945727 RepID=UPI0018830F5C|nr:hypothetical protein [Cyanobium sp. LEGE 06143]MBE9171821.1 hypothetical protein [Cyanobium sp. LEGE 06143]